MFIRTVTVTIPVEQEADMYAFWEWTSAIVRQQAGYIQGHLWRDTADPQRFTEVHEWEQEEDSNAYRATEQFREVIGRLVALSRTTPQTMGYRVVSDQRHVIDILAVLPGHQLFQNAEEVDTYMREERNSWEG